MKKTLVALAALASVSAFAQSSVTLYGRVDLGSDSNKTTTTNIAGTTTAVSKTTSLVGDQSGVTGMRLGVRGTEDLGGGLTAGFVFESAIQPDEAAAFGNTRSANLSLTGGFGRVVIGTFDNPLDAVRGYNQAIYSVPGGDFLSNMFNTSAAGAGSTFLVALGGANVIPVGLRQRSSNSIAYAGAANGFTFGIGTTSESADASSNGVATTKAKTSGYIGTVGYANGPLSAQLAIGQGKLSSGVGAAAATGKLNDTAFAVSYDLGMAKPYFTYETAKTTMSTATGAQSGNGWVLGSTFPMGAAVPYIAISKGSYKNTIAGANGKAKTDGTQVGVRYSLSKRSTVYAAYGNDKAADNMATSKFSSKRSGYAVGLRHDF